jgi:hypothetical protein
MFEKIKTGLLVVVALLVLVLCFVVFAPKKMGSVETNATNITNTSSLTKWQDGYFWGSLEVASNFFSTGNFRAASLVQTGSVATFTVTSTATAANVCDNPLWTVTPVTGTTAITLPVTTTLFADCLTTNGDSITFTVLNGSAVTSTFMVAGGGGTIVYSSSTTIAAGKAAIITVVRGATATYKALLVNLLN